MKTNHFLNGFMLTLTDVPMIVAEKNTKKEQKRILDELEALCFSKQHAVVTVDACKLSLDKVIPIIEISRLSLDKYRLAFITVLHPELEGACEFRESFYQLVQMGSSYILDTLMTKDEEFVIHYGRWVRDMAKEKLDDMKKANAEYNTLVESVEDVPQESTSWKSPHHLKSAQMDLSYLVGNAFNPVSKILDPHLALNPSPSFQRNLVWSVDKKQDFIDSILKSLPLGAFYINDNIEDLTLGEGYGRLLWDGKQRLHAILSFYKDEFPVHYEGKDLYYSQMRNTFNSAMRNTLVTIMTSQYETLDEIVGAYVMINAKQVKHTDEDLEKAKETLSKKQEKVLKF